MVILYLNDMRHPQVEMSTAVARAATKEELEQFVENERVPYYRDGKWSKCFRQGGPLEWYNEPSDFFFTAYQDAGTEEDWIGRARDLYAMQVTGVPVIDELVAKDG